MFPINVLRIVPSLQIGGIGKTLLDLLPRLDKNKYNVSVCCLYRRDVLADAMEKAGIRVFCLDMKAKLDINLKYLTGIIRLVNLLKRENIKIVHTHVYKASTPGRIVAILARVPIIIAHEDDLLLRKNEMGLENFLAKFTDSIIAVSGAVRDFYVEKVNIPEGKISMIYNGVDLEKFNEKIDINKKKEELGIPGFCKVIGTVGRLTKVKGHIFFLQSAKIVKEKMKDTKFLVVGGGSILQELKDYSSQLDITKDVIFTGAREDIPELLSVMDIFVLPSISEGLSVTILEAMAETKPVVASSVGGIPEIIQDGINGFLVPSRSPEALAEKILFLLKNEEIACKIAKNGKETVGSRFTLEKMVSDTEFLYDNLIKEKLKLK